LTHTLNGGKIDLLSVDPQTDFVAEVTRLTASIEETAAATEVTLAGHPPAHGDVNPGSTLAEQKELCRQLAALREQVARAEHRNEGPGALRAELATLMSFARTLHADAENWRSALAEQSKRIERERVAARTERESLAAEREQLLRRRDALQSAIVQTAARMAQDYRGEWRRTVPVVTLGEGLTVCSASVACPRRGFRFAKRLLVTLTGSHDVLVRYE
jgi:hypothetical protein